MIGWFLENSGWLALVAWILYIFTAAFFQANIASTIRVANNSASRGENLMMFIHVVTKKTRYILLAVWLIVGVVDYYSEKETKDVSSQSSPITNVNS